MADLIKKDEISERNNPDRMLDEGQNIQFPPRGYSMYPFLNPDKGDQVIVEPLSRTPRRGDVVLYRRDGEKGTIDAEGFECGILVLHRIIKRKGNEFYLVGDNQSQIEGPLRANQIKGIMTVRIRGHKHLSVNNLFYKIFAQLWLIVCPVRSQIKLPLAVIKRTLFKKS